MKKISIILIAIALATSLSLPVFAEQNEGMELKDKKIEMNNVNLTEKQKKEVQDIMVKINNLRKQLIDKYQGYGVINKEQADEIKAKMDKRMQMIKEKGFVPGKPMRKHKDKAGSTPAPEKLNTISTTQ